MKHRLMQVLSLVLALVLLFGSIPTAFAETPEIPVETEPPYTGVETDTGGNHAPHGAGGIRTSSRNNGSSPDGGTACYRSSHRSHGTAGAGSPSHHRAGL